MNETKGLFKEDFSSIMISRKFFGFIWIEYGRIQRELGQDGMELYKRTREIYRQAYGEDNVIFRLHYQDMKFRGNGTQIL